MTETTVTWPDVVAILSYFAIVLGVGLWATCRAKRESTQGYFLAGRSMTWIPIGASTWATNIGAPMFIGLAGTAAASGLAVVMFEWEAMMNLLMLGWLFLPVYMASGCCTMPEYLKKRYGGQRIRIWLAVVHTFLTITVHIAGQMYAGALFIQKIFNWDLYLSVALILGLTAVYTILGGLTAVIWTDTAQTVILVIGASILCIITLVHIGGWEAIRLLYSRSAANETLHDVYHYGNRTCGLPRDDAFHIFRSADADYPWPGMLFGLTILGINCWCTDQVSVQRSLSARSLSQAKAGLLLAAYLKIPSFLFFIIPGMASRILYPDEVACSDPVQCKDICNNPNGCSNLAFPFIVIRLLPAGLRGVMLAALLAALMSSLTSVFNSSSTVFTIDIWKRIRKRAKEAELMVVGRVYTLFLVLISILWLPVLQVIQGSQFWDYAQAIGSYLIPPAVVVFLLGIFWKRTTEKGAFYGLVAGLVVGLVWMALTWARPTPQCGSGQPDTRFTLIAKVHYLHFAVILAAIVAIVTICVSCVTAPRPPEKLHRVTFWTKDDPELPNLTESEDEPDDDNEADKNKEYTIPEDRLGRFKYFALRWGCGVNLARKESKFSKEERCKLQLRNTDIKENPFWKRFLDVQAVICIAVYVFLEAFWA